MVLKCELIIILIKVMTKDVITKLEKIIDQRKEMESTNSYVASLLNKGKVKIANKLGEEAVETVTAYLSQKDSEIVEESADLIFHLLVLLKSSNISFDDVLKVLEKRMKDD